MNGERMAKMSKLFHGKGVVSAILVYNFIGKEKFLDFLFLLVLGTSDRRRKETPRKQEE